MATIEQIKRGAARYLDEEFTNRLTGWQKWVFGAGAAMYLENLGPIAERLRQSPFVKNLGLTDDSGNVDIEKLRSYFLAEAQKGPITFTAPVLGTVKLSSNDVEKLCRYIAES